jgi:hypothetical protein
MKFEHCFGEELSSNHPEASACSRSRSMRLLALRIQQDWTQTSSLGIRIRNSAECDSRFYSQTKGIFSEVIPAVEGLLQEMYAQRGNNSRVLDFKLSLCFECRMLSFGLFPGVCSLNANVSEHSVRSIFMGE